MKTLTILAALGVICASAMAQLTLTSIRVGDPIFTNCHPTFGSFARSADVTATDVTLNAKGQNNVRLERTVGEAWSHQVRTYYAFEVGVTPIEITRISAKQYMAEGKIVIGGGSPDNEATVEIAALANLNEFVDADDDGEYDDDEETHFVQGFSPVFANRQGNGLTEYSIPLTDNPQSSVYVLGAQRHYFWDITTWLRGVTDTDENDPAIVVTHEYGSPYDGWHFKFDYRAVPEPASVIGLGLGALALLCRRRN